MGNNNNRMINRANAVSTAWATLAKDETFAGMTLPQYCQLLVALKAQETALTSLQAQYLGGCMQFNTQVQTVNASTLAVVDSVKANLTAHGPDSPLYKTMGYVPKSERASGLVRKTTATAASGSAATPVPTTAPSGSVKT